MSLSIQPPAGSAAERSRAYGFPYPVAYDIQLDFMDALFRAIENGKVGVFESPTGTGKSLSLLCGALTWLAANRERAAIGTLEADDEPDWVVAHAQAQSRATLDAERESLEQRLAEARAQRPAKRPRTREGDDDDDDDAQFLIGDPGPSSAHGIALSAQVRAAMSAFDAALNQDTAPPPETRPKVYFTSRTHSQLAQLIGELKKTPYSAGSSAVRTVNLASRRHTCLNATVQRLGAESGIEAMNERCIEMAEGRRPRCEFMPPADSAFDSFRDHALAHVCDIEELVSLGKRLHICPYFGARHAVREAQVVLAPYNMLLQKDARESLQLSLDESVVVIDEAHNLIDTVLSTYSPTLTAQQIASASDATKTYLARFSMQLRGTNEEHLRTLRTLLDALGAYCEHVSEDVVVTPSQFVAQLGGTLDQINFARIEAWLKETRIARKISGYAERQWMRAHPGVPPKTQGNRAMQAIEAFLIALADRSTNGRIVVSGRGDKVVIKYLLLDPADAFAPLLDAARAIIFAGGTMEPVSEFRDALLSDAGRFASFACGHIVPQENILAVAVERGPRGTLLEFGFEAWKNTNMLDELANAVSNYCNIIPHGTVVFFPSYASLGATLDRWRQSGALERISKRKQLFYEPRHAHQVEQVLTAYGAAVASPGATRGAILFAVVGGKLSEGINFSDDLARCVMMVGLPFPNIKSRELTERLAFVRQKHAQDRRDIGQELYVNMCMRAVNQSIGRAIRHARDHAVFILLDRRYARPDIRARLPAWIRSRVAVHTKFGTTIGAVAAFFRQKKNN